MNNVVVLDACTIVNLARIDEGDFLEDRVRTHRVFAIEEVLDEVKTVNDIVDVIVKLTNKE